RYTVICAFHVLLSLCIFFHHLHSLSFFFFFNATATTDIYTLSLHDALPIFSGMALLILALLQRIFLMSSLMLLLVWLILEISFEIGRAVQQECRDRSRMPSSA